MSVVALIVIGLVVVGLVGGSSAVTTPVKPSLRPLMIIILVLKFDLSSLLLVFNV